MIKKVLGYLIVLILAICAYFCVVKGVKILDFEILSYKDIMKVHSEYQEDVLTYNDMVENKYQTALNKLDNAKTSFEINKNAYEELKEYNSYEELLELTRDKQYPLEFLWIKLDLIAKNNNLNSKFVITDSQTGAKNINITLTGDYLAVKNYIYDILIDLELQFRAENITILPSGQNVVASFTVKDVKVIM